MNRFVELISLVRITLDPCYRLITVTHTHSDAEKSEHKREKKEKCRLQLESVSRFFIIIFNRKRKCDGH